MVVTETITRTQDLRFEKNAIVWLNYLIKVHDKFQEHLPCWKKAYSTIQQIESY
jgi:hypothetical protein